MSLPAQPISVIRSQRVLTPAGVLPRDIHLSQGKIQAVVPVGELPTSGLLDVGGLGVMPGVVDTHVHINEPGRTEWEGFTTATQAAAAGGITTLVDMPLNCIPVTTTAEALAIKCREARPQLWVDCGFYGGVVPGHSDELEPLIRAGVLGFKAFLIHSGIDDFPAVTETDLRAAMPILAKHGVPLLVHAELDCGHSLPHKSHHGRHYSDYLASRPGQWELDAIALMIRLCRETGCPVHIVHLSCAEALPMLADAKAEGLPLTVETCPHYLTLQAESVPEGDTRYKCAPPIRDAHNREALWQGLASGVIDFIVSDHSPCTPELKRLALGDFHEAWGGISSLQLGLSLVWTEARQRGLTDHHVADWMCRKPACFVKLDHRKGRIEPGWDADLVIWDPEARFTVTPDMLYHRHKVTPYEGKTLYGKVLHTLLRGQTVYQADSPFEHPLGQPLFDHVSPVQGASV